MGRRADVSVIMVDAGDKKLRFGMSVLRVCVCLGSGAALSTTIAIALAARSLVSEIPRLSSDRVRLAGDVLAAHHQAWLSSPPPGTIRTFEMIEARGVGLWDRIAVFLEEKAADRRRVSGTRVTGAGWPWIAFERRSDWSISQSPPPPAGNWVFFLRSQYFVDPPNYSWQFMGCDYRQWPPIGIKAMGFLGDTALLSVAVAFLSLTCRNCRKRLRRAKQRCVECGYELRGLKAGLCPECGTRS